MVARDAPSTILIWKAKLDKDIRDARSLILRLKGLDCASEVQKALDKTAEACAPLPGYHACLFVVFRCGCCALSRLCLTLRVNAYTS